MKPVIQQVSVALFLLASMALAMGTAACGEMPTAPPPCRAIDSTKTFNGKDSVWVVAVFCAKTQYSGRMP